MRCIKALLLVVFISSLPSTTFARHASRVDRSDLDTDIVETFPVPILFAVGYEDVTPDFGDPRGGGTRSHEGQDMRAPQGTPIVSPTEAIVIRTGDGDSSGKYVYTANPGGETFRYMHLDYVADIEPGDKLAVGDFIGTVGDTGNAPDGVYHLHLEVRDETNEPTDPYERFSEAGFTLKEEVSFLRGIFSDVRNDDEYAEFLVDTFGSEFSMALKQNYNLPSVVDAVLEETGAGEQVAATKQLTALIASLPAALAKPQSKGEVGAAVVLLQIYLIYSGTGPARDKLAAAGPTGYFGFVTEAALLEYQTTHALTAQPGVYDAATRTNMMQRTGFALNLN